jgi:hypothetical protein
MYHHAYPQKADLFLICFQASSCKFLFSINDSFQEMLTTLPMADTCLVSWCVRSSDIF